MKFNKPVKNYFFYNRVIDTLIGNSKVELEKAFRDRYNGYPYYDFTVQDKPKPDFYIIRVFERENLNAQCITYLNNIEENNK